MRITNIEIKNFRGIKECNCALPLDSRVVCLIGSGDSTKSSLLKAVEWAVWPSWNLNVTDNDFYNGNIDEEIIIRITFTDIPIQLLSENKFGLYLRKSGVELLSDIDDEPSDDLPLCLTLQLKIDATLEPKWEIVCNRMEPKSISNNDRKLLVIGVVGNDCEKDMLWGRYSVLQKYANAKEVLQNAYNVALREVSNNADLHSLDDVVDLVISVGKQYGVGFDCEVKNKLIMQSGSFSSSVGLYDGESPLTQRGLGSKRLLSMGLNIKSTSGEAILLIDEVENGLEPYRLRNLINELRCEPDQVGQVIMTTHSPIVVAECKLSEICVVQSKEGITSIYQLRSGNTETDKQMQAQLRKNAESFLSKRIIICEGKTEIGFIRALDTYLVKTSNYRLAYKGIGVADGGGSEIFNCADILNRCGYEVCLLMDSDLVKEENDKSKLRTDYGIEVFDWEQDNALEEQVFHDVPNNLVNKLVEIAVKDKGIDSVQNALKSNGISFTINDETIDINDDILDTKIIGTIAKSNKKCWYKRIDLGELLGEDRKSVV